MATASPLGHPLTRDEATSILLSKIFPLLGESHEGKGLIYSFLEENSRYFSFAAAVQGIHELYHKPANRYRVDIDCVSGAVRPPVLISLSGVEIAESVLQATGHHVAKYERFKDGALSIS